MEFVLKLLLMVWFRELVTDILLFVKQKSLD